MIFNKSIFIFLSCFFIGSCGLRIGEVAPGAPDYYLSSQPTACSQLDYKKVFLNYFFINEPSSPKVNQALACISSKVKEFKSLISHEFLSKRQTVNILNQDFIQTSNIQPIVDNILNPEYFYDYVSIINNLIYLAKPDSNRNYLSADWSCQMTPDNKNIISKESADVLVSFLGDLSKLFSSAEEEAYIVFKNFFKKRSISKWDIQNSNEQLTEFGSFLSDRLSQSFPSYSQFLKTQIAESDKTSFKETMYVDEYGYGMVEQEKSSKTPLRTAMTPLLETLNLPSSEEAEIRFRNVKNMMLNIYIMQAFFKVYDVNQDFRLSPQELKSLSCLMTPLVFILISPELKEEWKIIQNAYDPTAVSNYIINYQKFPSKNILDGNFWGFLWFRINKADELDSQSYTEVSQLVSLLFSLFFDKIQFEES
ncbi:MAG: hypothetical protein OXJ52_06845 [Oligoflexia bacterium]|nr:hypothetical protein [Oligoflexia bacterium]